MAVRAALRLDAGPRKASSRHSLQCVTRREARPPRDPSAGALACRGRGAKAAGGMLQMRHRRRYPLNELTDVNAVIPLALITGMHQEETDRRDTAGAFRNGPAGPGRNARHPRRAGHHRQRNRTGYGLRLRFPSLGRRQCRDPQLPVALRVRHTADVPRRRRRKDRDRQRSRPRLPQFHSGRKLPAHHGLGGAGHGGSLGGVICDLDLGRRPGLRPLRADGPCCTNRAIGKLPLSPGQACPAIPVTGMLSAASPASTAMRT